jgi:hypothetical protein
MLKKILTIFNPAHSPFLNSVEYSFNKIKKEVKYKRILSK